MMTNQDKVNECVEDLKKLFALPPYNHMGNLVTHDGYFANSLRDKYSDDVMKLARKEINHLRTTEEDKMNREGELKKLEEIKEKFEDKTANGLEFRLYDYIHSREYPILGAVLEDWELLVSCWGEDGIIETTGIMPNSSNLVLKNKHLPKDILCEVWGAAGGTHLMRYSSGDGNFFQNGSDSFSVCKDDMYLSWDNFKVIENHIRPWFGGECPVPHGLLYRVFVDNRWHDGIGKYDWAWGLDQSRDIIAYQILGEK